MLSIFIFCLLMISTVRSFPRNEFLEQIVGVSAAGLFESANPALKGVNILGHSVFKMFETRYFKLWQNLSKTEEGKRCFNDLHRLVSGIKDGEKWAIQTIDAWGKIGNGLAEGHVFVRGRSSLCLKARPCHNVSIPDYLNQFCWFDLTLHFLERYPIAGPRVGICLPNSCSYNLLYQSIDYPQAFFNRIPYMPYFRLKKCFPNGATHNHFSETSEAVSLIICFVLFTIIAVATIYDLWLRFSKRNCLQVTVEEEAAKEDEGDKKQRISLAEKASNEGILCNLRCRNTLTEIAEQHKTNEKKEEEIILFSKSRKHSDEESMELQFKPPLRETSREPGLFQRILLAFSLVSNTLEVFQIPKETGPFGCLHAIKVFSSGWVVMGHIINGHIQLSDNFGGGSGLALRQKIGVTVYTGGLFGVDSFFVMSGMLLTYIFLHERATKKKTNWFRFYIDRYLRISPANFFFLFVIFWGLMLNNPQKPDFLLESTKERCRKSWWYYILYIQNFLHSECFGIDWYLANDLQFSWLSPIFLLLFLFIGKNVGFIFFGIILVSIGISFMIISEDNPMHYSNYIFRSRMYPNILAIRSLYYKFYIRPYSRIGAYLIGMYVGWLVHQFNFKVKLSKMRFISLWSFGSFCLLISLFLGLIITMSDKGVYLFLSTSHVIWSLGLGIVIFLCSTGNGGIINTFLSWPGWVPASKLSFSVYLMHYIVLKLFYAHVEEILHTSYTDFVLYFFGLFHLCLLGGLFLYLIVEAPFKLLLKYSRS